MGGKVLAPGGVAFDDTVKLQKEVRIAGVVGRGEPRLDDMALTDQVTVGDMQAGISIQRGGGELSLSYIRREVKYKDRNGGFSENEDFAGISFTMRR